MFSMQRRKIQLVAGTTYTVSLPKDWVIKNQLREKDEIQINEKNNRTLLLSPDDHKTENLKEIELNIDDYMDDIDQVLFAVYYLGTENINLFSKDEFSKTVRARIRKTLTHMSGTEITYEDKKHLKIKVFLDKSKVKISQVLYRISLLLESNIENITGELNLDEISINENEIDRLYHLTAKIISMSLTETQILKTSGIRNISLIPHYFLIGKRLENIGDNLNHLGKYMSKNKVRINKKIFDFIDKELRKSIKCLISSKSKEFSKAAETDVEAMKQMIYSSGDVVVIGYMKDILRFLVNIQEEIVNINFYEGLIRDDKL